MSACFENNVKINAIFRFRRKELIVRTKMMLCIHWRQTVTPMMKNDDDNDEDDEDILYSLMPEPGTSLTKAKTKEKTKKVTQL